MGEVKRSPLDDCEYGEIEIATNDGSNRLFGHRRRELAVHKAYGAGHGWTVTHLPTGTAIARGFESVDQAASAMVEIDRLRNEWLNITYEEQVTLRGLVEAIAEKHGGFCRTNEITKQRPEEYYRPSLNGFATPAAEGGE